MENASKALIIAGSVLLAVLLIAFGMTIFNRARSSDQSSQLETQEVTMFNSGIEKYAGQQNGSHVKSMISYLIGNANTNKDEDIKRPTVELKKSDGTGIGEPAKGSSYGTAQETASDYISALGSLRPQIVSTSMYKVTPSYGTSGLINLITVTLQD